MSLVFHGIRKKVRLKHVSARQLSQQILCRRIFELLQFMASEMLKEGLDLKNEENLDSYLNTDVTAIIQF
jgi:hypothetical protein